MEIIIELLGTSHNVIERLRFCKEKISIGRGYDNDVILTEQHVDAQHATLYVDEAGQWCIEDLDSVNGLKKNKERHPRARHSIDSGDIFLLGRTKIRILRPDHPVAPATPIRRVEVFLLALGDWPVLSGLFIAYILAMLLRFYLSVLGGDNWQIFVLSQLQTVTMYVGLAIGVYLLSILFKRSGHFLSHLGVLTLIALTEMALSVLVQIIWYNTSSDWDSAIRFAETVIERGALFIYLWCVLYLAFHLSLLWRTAISAALIVMTLVFSMLSRNEALMYELMVDQPKVDWSMLPTAFLLRPTVSQAAFFEEASATFEEAAKERQRIEDEND
ncbi:MAG: hypothetical protein DHS20C11_25840 [Lysobacteraceae bacterium]|nr:MAG: hypothetical protein DHS20C11_25840 [Xanthomonadaceae bacterium]